MSVIVILLLIYWVFAFGKMVWNEKKEYQKVDSDTKAIFFIVLAILLTILVPILMST